MAYIKLTQKANGVVNINALLTEFSYGGVTHKNRNDRYGIAENIWIVSLQYRINNGAWIDKGAISNCDVKLNNNGDKLEVWCHYRHDTQGYHHKNSALPFFYYTDQNGNVADARGYKTNGSCPWIFNVNEARTYCKMPSNWNPVGGGKDNTSISWTDWAKSHANTSDKLWWQSGPQHEQRHASYFGSYSDGWFSGQGKWNYYRRSCLWRWECKETVSIICSGIGPTEGPKPATPTLKIYDAYGNSGKVRLTNNDSKTGYMMLGAWIKELNNGANVDGTFKWILKGKEGIVAPNVGFYSNTWGPYSSYDVNIDFDAIWGEKYSSKDVYYQLSIVNDANKESDYAPHAGKQHYNARPTIPQVSLTKNGKTLVGSWKSTDPDPRDYSTANLPASSLTYDVVLEKDGSAQTLFTKTSSTTTTINVEEGANYVLKARSHDGRIYSKDWGYSNKQQQGFNSIAPKIIFPLHNSTLYNPKPRIILFTNSKTGTDELVCTYNGVTYSSKTDTDCFSSSTIPKGKNFMIFKPRNGASSKATITVKSINDDSEAIGNTIDINIGNINLSLPNNEYVKGEDFKVLDIYISNVRNAYGLSEFFAQGSFGYIEAEDVNLYTEQTKDIDDIICSYNSRLRPTIYSDVTSKNDYIAASDFNNIVTDLKNM